MKTPKNPARSLQTGYFNDTTINATEMRPLLKKAPKTTQGLYFAIGRIEREPK